MREVRRRLQIAKANPLFWVNLGLVLVSLTAFYLPGPTDFRIRTLGAALQLIAVATIWFDLSATARRYAKTGILSRTWQWLKQLLTGWPRVVSGDLVGSYTISDTFFGSGSVRVATDGMILEQRLSVIEKRLDQMEDNATVQASLTRKEFQEVRGRITEVESSQVEAIKSLQADIAEATVGNYAVLLFGLVWLIVGVLLATNAPEWAKMARGDWIDLWLSL